jgi:hypothetical protein
VEIGTEVTQLPEKEYINGIFLEEEKFSCSFFGPKLTLIRMTKDKKVLAIFKGLLL